MLDIRLLGPITAERDGEPVSLGGPRQRAVLARLALVPGHVVTVDRLVDDVWAGRPAGHGGQHAAELRLPAAAGARRRRSCCGARAPATCWPSLASVLDAARFEDGVAAARASCGDPARALAPLDAALGEWRGPVLADVADEDWARSAAVRWEELRLEALETRFDALLAIGRHGEAAAELEQASRRAPAARGLRPAADGRPVPQRSAGRCAARLPPDARRCSPTSSASIPRRRSSRCRRRSSTTIPRWPRRRSGRRTPPGRTVVPAVAGAGREPSGRAGGVTGAAPRPGRAGRRHAFVGRERPAGVAAPRWDEVIAGDRAPRAAPRRGRRRQVAPRPPASPPKRTAAAPSCCGAGRRPRRSCRSSRWSRRCAPRCAPCRRRPDGAWPPSVACSPCCSPSSTTSCPRRALERPGPDRRALPAVRDRGRAPARRVARAPVPARAGRRAVGRWALAEDDRARAAPRAALAG